MTSGEWREIGALWSGGRSAMVGDVEVHEGGL